MVGLSTVVTNLVGIYGHVGPQSVIMIDESGMAWSID